MAGAIVTGGGWRGRRALDADINMVPMIDLLMVTIAFLLVTAVWSQMHRLDGTAKVPAPIDDVPSPQAVTPYLHVDVRSPDHFVLSWRQGAVVTRSVDVPHDYASLEEAVAREYRTSGVHTSPADPERDVAVLHTSDEQPFSDMVAAMDAIAATKRPLARGQAPAFALTLSTR
ncbi:MAG: ExbD/TolR family protein [Polyangiaceae bacterium]